MGEPTRNSGKGCWQLCPRFDPGDGNDLLDKARTGESPGLVFGTVDGAFYEYSGIHYQWFDTPFEPQERIANQASSSSRGSTAADIVNVGRNHEKELCLDSPKRGLVEHRTASANLASWPCKYPQFRQGVCSKQHDPHTQPSRDNGPSHDFWSGPYMAGRPPTDS